jgi:hypothetical protein
MPGGRYLAYCLCHCAARVWEGNRPMLFRNRIGNLGPQTAPALANEQDMGQGELQRVNSSRVFCRVLPAGQLPETVVSSAFASSLRRDT